MMIFDGLSNETGLAFGAAAEYLGLFELQRLHLSPPPLAAAGKSLHLHFLQIFHPVSL